MSGILRVGIVFKLVTFAHRILKLLFSCAAKSSKYTIVFLSAIVGLIGMCAIFVVVPRDVAFRSEHPSSSACNLQRQHAADLMAARGSEIEAVAHSRLLKFGLRCDVQRHDLAFSAADWPDVDPTRLLRSYYLAFLEFGENGSPYVLRNGPRDDPVISQLDAIQSHLSSHRPNYVIAFIHGWRHDARIGDGNIADLHLQLAFATSFLLQRCLTQQRDCDATVTGIYIGWRGARVDEKAISGLLGRHLGNLVSNIVVAPTLFDRKPVSEAIGASAVAALKAIAEGLKLGAGGERMLTLGHSLGGNMLISTLSEPISRAIARHPAEQVFPSPIGSLVVLLNPAAEAAKWTHIQRAVLDRITLPGEVGDVAAGHRFFPANQPPALMALTAAESWPAGGIRKEDCEGLRQLVRQGDRYATGVLRDIRGRKNEFNSHPVYDFATYDLFPAFKGDLRPLALTLDRYAARMTGSFDLEESCNEADEPHHTTAISRMINIFANTLRTAPFMNTDDEQTHTIGHLNPPRPPFGLLWSFKPRPYRPLGTTHELVITGSPAQAAQYGDAIVRSRSECAVVDGWLTASRARTPPYGLVWDSGYTLPNGKPGDPPNLTPVQPARGDRAAIEAQFRHGLLHSGEAPIMRANDPFWNVRAFDTALAEHGGFTSFPLICVLNQLVMDRITAVPSSPVQRGSFQ